MIKIGFITGARSEYGVMRPLIRELSKDGRFDVSIIATGMHFLQRYGHTIDDIYQDGFAPIIEAPCYEEKELSKKEDFVALINAIYSALQGKSYNVVYLIGDRLEAYAAALTAHFLHIPIAHYAGGQITEGAVDNIYRYNISNLASLHFVTNKYAEERLKRIPIICHDKIYLVGSSAIDAIYDYLKHPQDAVVIDPKLMQGNYVLMTFHPETNRSAQDGCSVPEMMDIAIRYIVAQGDKVLITYPNNDEGAAEIISVINQWQNNPNVVVRQNLGVQLYYVAVDNAKYVIGNSSSAIIEVPYFSKYSLDIGVRQKGRNAPQSVIHIPNQKEAMIEYLVRMQENAKVMCPQEYIYGIGESVVKIKEILIKEIYNENYK